MAGSSAQKRAGMKGAVALIILIVTVLGCLAVDRLLHLQIDRQREAISAVERPLKDWEVSPSGRRLTELSLKEERLRASLQILKDTPSRALGFALLLAAVDGLGTDLRTIHYREGQVDIGLTRDPEKALARLKSLPGTTDWGKLGPDMVGGSFRP